jgi:alpha-amylase
LLQDWVKRLVTEFSFDGIRIDTVKHVEHDFWPAFSEAAGVYSVGEVWTGNVKQVASYASGMSGLLNYPIYYTMKNFYQQQGSAQDIVDTMAEIDTEFPDPTALATFLDNHDVPRALHENADISLLKNALAYVLLARGIPIVFYGTEQAFAGGDDPFNREDLWRSSFNTTTDLYKTIASLSFARAQAGGLPDDDHVHLHVTNNAYAWSRASGSLIVFTTNTGSGTTGHYCFNAGRANGAWDSVFSGSSSTVTSDSSGNLCVSVANGEPVVLLASNSGGGGDANNGTVIPTGTQAPSSMTAASSTATGCPSVVAVTFNAHVTTQWGDTVKVVGNTAQLGRWVPADAPALSADGYSDNDHLWSGTIELPAGEAVAYKLFIAKSDGTASWEDGENRSYTVPACQASGSVEVEWR